MGDLLIGIDVGGTFTDAIVFDSSNGSLLSAFKVPSSTGEPGKAVIDAIAGRGTPSASRAER